MEQVQTSQVRHRRNRQQIQDLLSLFSTSNANVKDFCKQHNIHPANFYKWKTRYKTKVVRKPKSAGFATLDIVEGSPVVLPGLFAEVNGIRIYQAVDASFLKQLLA